jgi:hypothetical protein
MLVHLIQSSSSQMAAASVHVFPERIAVRMLYALHARFPLERSYFQCVALAARHCFVFLHVVAAAATRNDVVYREIDPYIEVAQAA